MKRSHDMLYIAVNPRCRFCLGTDPIERIQVVCDCSPPTDYAHIDCLVRGIGAGIIPPICQHCRQPFRGIIVKIHKPSCWDWLRRDERARWDVLGSPIIILYLVYLSFLGHLCYVTHYWKIFPVLRYFIVDMLNAIFYMSVAAGFVAIVKTFVDLQDWKRRNTEVMATPVIVPQNVNEMNKRHEL